MRLDIFSELVVGTQKHPKGVPVGWSVGDSLEDTVAWGGLKHTCTTKCCTSRCMVFKIALSSGKRLQSHYSKEIVLQQGIEVSLVSNGNH